MPMPVAGRIRRSLRGLQVYAADGTYLRNVPNALSDLHGFIINKEANGEFIYGVRVAETAGQQIRPRPTGTSRPS
jgi:hypothetical protein